MNVKQTSDNSNINSQSSSDSSPKTPSNDTLAMRSSYRKKYYTGSSSSSRRRFNNNNRKYRKKPEREFEKKVQDGFPKDRLRRGEYIPKRGQGRAKWWERTLQAVSLIQYTINYEGFHEMGFVVLSLMNFQEITKSPTIYPLHFRVINKINGMFTYVGVKEFTAINGLCYCPKWLMKQLQIEDGELIDVVNVKLQDIRRIELKPLEKEEFFKTVKNPRKFIKDKMKNFVASSLGDTYFFSYEEKSFTFVVCYIEGVVNDNIKSGVIRDEREVEFMLEGDRERERKKEETDVDDETDDDDSDDDVSEKRNEDEKIEKSEEETFVDNFKEDEPHKKINTVFDELEEDGVFDIPEEEKEKQSKSVDEPVIKKTKPILQEVFEKDENTLSNNDEQKNDDEIPMGLKQDFDDMVDDLDDDIELGEEVVQDQFETILNNILSRTDVKDEEEMERVLKSSLSNGSLVDFLNETFQKNSEKYFEELFEFGLDDVGEDIIKKYKCLLFFFQMQTTAATLREFSAGISMPEINYKKVVEKFKIDGKFESLEEAKKKKKFRQTKTLTVGEDFINSFLILTKKGGANPVIVMEVDGKNKRECIHSMEEDFSVQTNYSTIMDINKDVYPLNDDELFFCDKIYVMRKNMTNKFEWLKEGINTSLIASNQMKDNEIENEEEFVKSLQKRLRGIFDLALKKGHRGIIMNNWGAGYQEIDPEIVANAIKEVVDEYSGVFAVIIFSIIEKSTWESALTFGNIFGKPPKK